MEKGPQYITSIQKRVHNTLVQYGKRSTIYKFNMEKGPQYNTGKGPQYFSSIWKRVHNMLVGNGPQYISSIWIAVHNTLVNTESVHSSV